MAHLAAVEASCAICGAPPSPFAECPHEGERLELALNQAAGRWDGLPILRDWALNHAKNYILGTFKQLKDARYAHHVATLHTLPCYALYKQWAGQPPMMNYEQLRILQARISQLDAIYKAGIDEDWRRSCMKYPQVLDYYFGLIEIRLPEDRDPAVREPRFGEKERKKVKARRETVDMGGGSHKKKGRRRSRDRTPPSTPMIYRG